MKLNIQKIMGSDAAEFEEKEVLDSYIVEFRGFTEFSNSQDPFRIAKGYKGVGKTALLLHLYNKLESENNFAIMTLGTDIAPRLSDSASLDEWIYEWKKKIINVVASEIGSKINAAYTDDATSLIELAEKNNFKQRSIISYVIDRIKTNKLPTLEKAVNDNYEKIVSRWSDQKKSTIYIVIDDLDLDYDNTKLFNLKIASFFNACKSLYLQIPQLKFRVGIRPNVWTNICLEFESIKSHFGQYITELKWSEEEFKTLLIQRIKRYLSTVDNYANVELSDEKILSLIFENPMDWASKKKPPHSVLYTLSMYRPRWMIELCKQASGYNDGAFINLDSINKSLPEFGKQRQRDTVAEFKSQCPQIMNILTAFVNQNVEYTTSELLDLIQNRVLQSTNINIAGENFVDKIAIARLLFSINFIFARKDFENGNYEHLTYSDKPELLHVTNNLDQGYYWEVHPVFRQALNLQSKNTVQKQVSRKKNPRK